MHPLAVVMSFAVWMTRVTRVLVAVRVGRRFTARGL
jgi:hypothetical protein